VPLALRGSGDGPEVSGGRHQVLAFFAFPAPWRHRLRTTNLGEGWFKHYAAT